MPDPRQFLDMLTDSLRLLAATAHEQVAALPSFVPVADEIALTFGECMLLVPQIRDACLIGDEQESELRAIDTLLEGMSGEGHAEFWSEEALRTDPLWERLRQMARRALESLGAEPGAPSMQRYTYVRAKPPHGDGGATPDSGEPFAH